MKRTFSTPDNGVNIRLAHSNAVFQLDGQRFTCRLADFKSVLDGIALQVSDDTGFCLFERNEQFVTVQYAVGKERRRTSTFQAVDLKRFLESEGE